MGTPEQFRNEKDELEKHGLIDEKPVKKSYIMRTTIELDGVESHIALRVPRVAVDSEPGRGFTDISDHICAEYAFLHAFMNLRVCDWSIDDDDGADR